MNAFQRNHVQFHGNGQQTLVLANGFGCNQSIWRPLIDALTQRLDVSLVTFDYTGSGRSDTSAYSLERYGDLEGYAQDLIEICEQLEPPCSVIGHSVSGAIGMLASRRAPHCMERLIAIGPSPCYFNDGDYRGGFEREDLDELLALLGQNRQHWADLMAPRVMDNPQRPELSDALREHFRTGDPHILHRFGQATFLSDIRAKLASVPVSVDIIYNQNDMIVPEQAVRYLERRLPDSRLHRIDANGHYPHLSEPEQLADTLMKILATAKSSA